jgi:hypothetical protein
VGVMTRQSRENHNRRDVRSQSLSHPESKGSSLDRLGTLRKRIASKGSSLLRTSLYGVFLRNFGEMKSH